jgi:hypothetical protein
MVKLVRSPRLSGMIAADDVLHAVASDPGSVIAPTYVEVPGGKYVPQYAPTVVATTLAYAPATDCDGCFMSYKFQANNNCYNYSCDIASNSFAQPGRMHGFFLEGAPAGADVVKGAELDGLLALGDERADLIPLEDGAVSHYVALLISPADTSLGWPGDYHWVRCDDNVAFRSWSQKDGGDQVTNFDFAGSTIGDPSTGNWTVNQGPLVDGNPDDIVVSYDFFAYMSVPASGVSII